MSEDSNPVSRKESHRKWQIPLLIAVVVGMALGVIHLIQLRFSTGDNYPSYSSFRTDPLGSKILYDSLYESRRERVFRNFQPLSTLKSSPPRLLFWLGDADFQEPRLEENLPVLDYVKKGNTVVLALKPNENALSTRSQNPGRLGRPGKRGSLLNTNILLVSLLSSLQVSLTNLTADHLVHDLKAKLDWNERPFPAAIPWKGSVGF
ncbi:MAG: hypothetical protein JWN25_3474, partial [Verrucomicrobiales bacterium]|nr:hypothetical protein [Verrucomicrobiales bacterium]